MSSSKLVADRVMLDLDAVISSLRYSLWALQRKRQDTRQYGKELLHSVGTDIGRISNSYSIRNMLSHYYGMGITDLSELQQIFHKVSNGEYADIELELRKLHARIEERLSERFGKRILKGKP